MNKYLFLIVVLISKLMVIAQSSQAICWAKGANTPVKSGVVIQNNTQKSVISRLLFLPYMVYKYTISSQDASMCSFYPSCANHGLNAVQKHGLLGIFYSFDRVSRCHGIYPSIYLQHPIYFINWDEVP